MTVKEQSKEEIRLGVLEHFADFISKLTDEPDKDACMDFASTMLDAVSLSVLSKDENGVITATMELKPIEDLLADFNSGK